MAHQVESRKQGQRFGDVDLEQREPGVELEVFEILGAAGGQVVEADHLGAAVEQLLAQVRTEEAGAAGDERTEEGHDGGATREFAEQTSG